MRRAQIMIYSSYAKPQNKVHNFTLIEIVTVISIVLIISGIVLVNIKLPVFATLDGATKTIRKIFTEASTQSGLQGIEMVVAFKKDKQEFILYRASEEKDLTFTLESLKDRSESILEVQKIVKKIEIEFPDYKGDEDIKFRFFPDGSASGPELTLTLNDRKIIVGISQLTGLSYSREETE